MICLFMVLMCLGADEAGALAVRGWGILWVERVGKGMWVSIFLGFVGLCEFDFVLTCVLY